MTDEDRAELTEALNAVTNDQVLITHGTMPETALYLWSRRWAIRSWC